jgi:transcriptional regulator with XRE-family HTH domain
MIDDHTDTAGTTELGEFLRMRRARLTREQAGLPTMPGSRRVMGLRREEVAQLAGLSLEVYAALERGRGPDVSESVLGAVAGALGLNDAERRQLLEVAGPMRVARHPMRAQRIRPGLIRVLDSLTDVPAVVTGHRMDVLAMNPTARAFHVGLDLMPPGECNMLRYLFLTEPARQLYADWPAAARGAVAALQVYAARHPHDPQLAELAGELSRQDPDFRQWWGEHEGHRRARGTRDYRHPVAGDLALAEESLNPAGELDQTLGLLIAEPGTASEHALRLLVS